MRIAIVNDMVMAVECLRRAVVSSPEHEIAWIAVNGAEAVEKCRADRPDLILMDLYMPEMDGAEATRQIMRESPCAVLVVTSDVEGNAELVFRAMGAGALDAVNTPLCVGAGREPAAGALLEKIATLRSLVSHQLPPLVMVPECGVGTFTRTDFPLVIVGASAGGPNALAEFLARLPAKFAAGIVVVQHVDAHFASELARWLGQQTRRSVRVVQQGEAPRSGEVLVAATDDHLVLRPDRSLVYEVEPRKAVYKPSVDVFFNSVLCNWQGPIAAVLLSGMGRDGAEAMVRLREAGYLTCAQDEASAAVYGMPRAAKELGGAVQIMPPAQIADTLVNWVKNLAALAAVKAAEMASETTETSLSSPLDADSNIARVMLVDDQLIVFEAFRRMLEDVDDVELRYCSDPARAIAEAQVFRPTVILQDLVMPGMNGLMLLGLLRSDPATKNIPVIVLSTKEDPKIKSEAFAIGASDYLVKFPDRIELLARIRAQSRSFLVQEQRDQAYRELRTLKFELERKNAELEALSCRDGLTGVLNRRAFDEYIGKEWSRAIRENGDVGLLLIDIDYFKNYNDTFGHQDGDECLRRVAVALGAGLKRPSDIVARYGGEEFAVILPDVKVEGGAVIAESLRSAVENLHLAHDYSAVADHVTISIGVASTRPKSGQLPEHLLRAADKALYEAKANGRNRVAVARSLTEG